MDQTAITKDLMGLEKKYWQAMIDHDLKTAVELTDFPCLVAGPQGAMSVDRAQFEKMFNSHGEETARDFKFEAEPQVRLLNETTAVVAYKVQSNVTKDGEKKAINAVDASTWIKRGDHWVCAMHTEALASAPNDKSRDKTADKKVQ